MMALMLGMTGMVAQNKVVVAGAGDVTLRPGEQTLINEGSVTRTPSTPPLTKTPTSPCKTFGR